MPQRNTSLVLVINFMAKLYNISSIPRSQIDEILYNIQEPFEKEIDSLVLNSRNKNVELDNSIQEELENRSSKVVKLIPPQLILLGVREAFRRRNNKTRVKHLSKNCDED